MQGELQRPLEVPARGADAVGARLGVEGADDAGKCEDHQGPPFAPAARERDASGQRERGQQQDPRRHIGVGHRRGEGVPGDLEVAEQLVGGAKEPGFEGHEDPPVVGHEAGHPQRLRHMSCGEPLPGDRARERLPRCVRRESDRHGVSRSGQKRGPGARSLKRAAQQAFRLLSSMSTGGLSRPRMQSFRCGDNKQEATEIPSPNGGLPLTARRYRYIVN